MELRLNGRSLELRRGSLLRISRRRSEAALATTRGTKAAALSSHCFVWRDDRTIESSIRRPAERDQNYTHSFLGVFAEHFYTLCSTTSTSAMEFMGNLVCCECNCFEKARCAQDRHDRAAVYELRRTMRTTLGQSLGCQETSPALTGSEE